MKQPSRQTLGERLRARKEHLVAELAAVDKALGLLEQNPTIQQTLDALNAISDVRI